MKSLPRVDLQSVFTFLIPFLLFSLLVDRTQCAPAVEGEDVDGGCYYMFNHYGEGDRILTNEPCLNCTCHNSMLMCYLRVCPFTKPIGQDCTIEKKPDQCCPVISCPQVPVSLVTPSALTSTTLPTTSLASVTGSTELATFERGCEIEGKNYPDGAQVIGDPTKPCELCYCIRNRTACVMQECILHVEGCEPVFQSGVCCPVRYQCDYPLQITDQSTVAGLITTTISSLFSSTPQPGGCLLVGEYYADGSQIPAAGPSPSPCEHCYCMRGEIVCAVQECGTPLENEGANCTAIPPGPGLCCPDKYTCESDMLIDEPGTTLSSLSLDPVVSSDPELQNQEITASSSDEPNLENQTEGIPVSVEPLTGSTGDATKEMESSEKVESSTVGQDDASIQSESFTKPADKLMESSSTKLPEHDIIINESATNETDIETHSRVSEKPSIAPSPDLEDEDFDGSMTTHKAVSEDIQPSEILSDDKAIVDLDKVKNNTSENITPEVKVSTATEKTENASELSTNAPEYTTISSGSTLDSDISADTSVLASESDAQPEKTGSPENQSEALINDIGSLSETSTEKIPGYFAKPIDSATDKLIESSTENLLVVSKGPFDTEESSTEKIITSSVKPVEGSTENLIISSENNLEAFTENVHESPSKQPETFTDGAVTALDSSTTKSIESSTENLIHSSETASVSSSEDSISENPLDDNPVVANEKDASSQISSTGTSISDSEISVTTVKTLTGEQSVTEPENEDTANPIVSDEGSVGESQTTPEPLTKPQMVGESDGHLFSSEKHSNSTAVPVVENQDSLTATTMQTTGAFELEADNQKLTTIRPDVDSNLQTTEQLDDDKKESQLSGQDEQSSDTDKATFTTPPSSIIGDIQSVTSPGSDLSEFPTTQKPSQIANALENQDGTLGNDAKEVETENPAAQNGVSSYSTTDLPETVEVSEINKESELSQMSATSSKPIEHEGFVMGELTVSSTPEAPESLSMHKTSTSSPVTSSSVASLVLPSGMEADNEIGEEAGQKISDEPSVSEVSDIISQPISSTLTSDIGIASQSTSESPVTVPGQEDDERTTQHSVGETINHDHPDVEEKTTLRPTEEQSEIDSQKSTETPVRQNGDESYSGLDNTSTKPVKIETGSNSEKPSETSTTKVHEQDTEKATEASLLPGVSNLDKTTETPIKLSDEVSSSDLDKPTEVPQTSMDKVIESDKFTDTPSKLSGEGTESDKPTETATKLTVETIESEKPTETPLKLSGDGIEADKVTETPIKLSGDGVETDNPTETSIKHFGDEIESDNPTETPIKLSGDGIESEKSTEIPTKLSGDGIKSEMPTETSIKLSGDGIESEMPTETAIKLSGDGIESDKPTETPTKLSGDGIESEMTETSIKLSGDGIESEMQTEPSIKLSGDGIESEMPTETPIKLSGDGIESDKPTETPIKLSGDGIESDKPTETPIKLSGDGVDTDNPTETPIKLSGDGIEADKVTKTPIKLSGDGVETDNPTETSIKHFGDEIESDNPTETPIKLSGDGIESEKSTEIPNVDQPTESPSKLAGDKSESDTDKPSKLVAEESLSVTDKPTETPLEMASDDSGSDLDNPTETPSKLVGDENVSDTDKPAKLAGEESLSVTDKPTETTPKIASDDNGSDLDNQTETPPKLASESNGSGKSTETPSKLTNDSDLDKPTETPPKIASDDSGTGLGKPTETPGKLGSEDSGYDLDNTTGSPVPLAGQDTSSDMETATDTPITTVVTESNLDTEKLAENSEKNSSVKPGTSLEHDTELEKSPEDQEIVHDQSNLENTTHLPIELSSSTNQANIDKISDVISQSSGIDTIEKTTEIPSLKPDFSGTEDTKNHTPTDVPSQEDTDVAATEASVMAISAQNLVGGEIIAATSMRPGIKEGQLDAETVTEVPVKPSNVQEGSEMITDDAPSKSVGGEGIRDKVSIGEEVPSSDDTTANEGVVTTQNPKPDSDGSSGINVDQTTTSKSTFDGEKSTTNVTSPLGSDSVLSDNLPTSNTGNTLSSQSPDATKLGIYESEAEGTTRTPDASAVNIPEQIPVEITQKEVEGVTTHSPMNDDVTKSWDKEQSMTESSDAVNVTHEDSFIHDEPWVVAGVTDPTSISVPDGFQSMTTVASETNESQTTLKPDVISIQDSENKIISTSTSTPALEYFTSTKAFPDDVTDETASQDDKNSGSTLSLNNELGEALTHDMKNLTDSQISENLTTMRPLDDSSRDPEATSAVPTEHEGSSTHKPSPEIIEIGITTEKSAVKLPGIPDMSETASEKLSDESSTDIVLTDSNTTEMPTRIPGEGNCFVEGNTYKNGSSIPPTTPCHIVCACQNSIVHCLLVHCPPPPNNYGDCKPIYKNGVCCPEYDCDTSSEGSSVTVTPGPGLGFTKDVNFVTVTPETPSLETSEASQDETFLSDSLNATDANTTSRPISVSQSVESSESVSQVSQESEEDKISSIGSGILKPIKDLSLETSGDIEDSSQNYLSSTFASSLVSEQTPKPVISEDESAESINATGVGTMFVSSESPISVPSSSLSSIAEGILDASKLEEALNITSDSDSSPLPPGSYYPVTTTTSVTPSSAAWPYPTSTPASVMSTGACLFDGRVYMSAQQIPRDDPCDFCFCFRGDIICLQQSCPPPIPGCYEEPIPGFCCPRYECPVGNGNVTTEQPLFPPSYYHNQILNGVASGQNPGAIANMPSGPGCEIQGEYYESGQVITSTSGPCLECRCGATGMMECDPRECQPEPMLRKMIAAITSR